MKHLQTYQVKNPLKSKTIFSEQKKSKEMSKEIQYRLKLIEKAFR